MASKRQAVIVGGSIAGLAAASVWPSADGPSWFLSVALIFSMLVVE